MIRKQQAAQVSLPSGREVEVTRSFQAPRALVYDAYTKPELMKRWLLGPPGWTMPVCEMDVRVGGSMGDGEALVTVRFEERDGLTAVTTSIEYASQEDRNTAMSTGMTDGMEMSYQRLDELLAEAATSGAQF